MLLSALAAVPGAGATAAEVAEQLRLSVVMIGVLDANRAFVPRGTGFFVDERCTVATANHVVRGSAEHYLQAPAVQGSQAVYGSAEVLRRFEENDIAFLRLGLDDDRCRAFSHLPPPARIRQRELNGAEVLVAGFPGIEGGSTGRTPVYRRGIVASGEFGVQMGDSRVPMYLLDLTGIPGFSGSPVVLLDSGEAIAVIHGPRKTDRKYDLEWATPLWAVQYGLAVSSQ